MKLSSPLLGTLTLLLGTQATRAFLSSALTTPSLALTLSALTSQIATVSAQSWESDFFDLYARETDPEAEADADAEEDYLFAREPSPYHSEESHHHAQGHSQGHSHSHKGAHSHHEGHHQPILPRSPLPHHSTKSHHHHHQGHHAHSHSHQSPHGHHGSHHQPILPRDPDAIAEAIVALPSPISQPPKGKAPKMSDLLKKNNPLAKAAKDPKFQKKWEEHLKSEMMPARPGVAVRDIEGRYDVDMLFARDAEAEADAEFDDMVERLVSRYREKGKHGVSLKVAAE